MEQYPMYSQQYNPQGQFYQPGSNYVAQNVHKNPQQLQNQPNYYKQQQQHNSEEEEEEEEEEDTKKKSKKKERIPILGQWVQQERKNLGLPPKRMFYGYEAYSAPPLRCVVCHRSDLPLELRKSGHKCVECLGCSTNALVPLYHAITNTYTARPLLQQRTVGGQTILENSVVKKPRDIYVPAMTEHVNTLHGPRAPPVEPEPYYVSPYPSINEPPLPYQNYPSVYEQQAYNHYPQQPLYIEQPQNASLPPTIVSTQPIAQEQGLSTYPMITDQYQTSAEHYPMQNPVYQQ